MKRVPLYIFFLLLLFVLDGCTQEARIDVPTVEGHTLLPTPQLDRIPIAIGETTATDSNALVGTWKTKDLSVSAKGTISGNLAIYLNRPVDFPQYQDVLVIQVWANYVWPQYGDMLIKPAGTFIPVKATQSTTTSAAFAIAGNFDIPPVMLETDGGMPLHHLQVTMVWYRLFRTRENGYASYQAKVGIPEKSADQVWGMPIFNQTVSLNGAIDTNVRSGLDYSKWFAEHISLPTSTPGAYPEPVSTPAPLPTKADPYPYPVVP